MTVSANSTKPSPEQALRERVSLIAGIGEKLSEGHESDERALGQQANFLFVQIDEQDDLGRKLLLAGMGLDLSAGHEEDDDLLGQQVFYLFEQITEELVTSSRSKIAAAA